MGLYPLIAYIRWTCPKKFPSSDLLRLLNLMLACLDVSLVSFQCLKLKLDSVGQCHSQSADNVKWEKSYEGSNISTPDVV